MSQVSNLKLQQQNHKNVYEIIRITKLGPLFFTKRVVCKWCHQHILTIIWILLKIKKIPILLKTYHDTLIWVKDFYPSKFHHFQMLWAKFDSQSWFLHQKKLTIKISHMISPNMIPNDGLILILGSFASRFLIHAQH